MYDKFGLPDWNCVTETEASLVVDVVVCVCVCVCVCVIMCSWIFSESMHASTRACTLSEGSFLTVQQMLLEGGG